VYVGDCENRSIFSKDMDKSIVSPFLTHGVHCITGNGNFWDVLSVCLSVAYNWNAVERHYVLWGGYCLYLY